MILKNLGYMLHILIADETESALTYLNVQCPFIMLKNSLRN